ncbi:heterokaryon incompatibility protein [Apiospora arundinis]
MICTNCKTSILEGNQTWGYHQLQSSASHSLAEEDCILCGWIQDEAATWLGSDFVATSSDDKHIYRWTVHRSPKFRESKASCTIHFRPVVSRFPQLQNAPRKTFHLIHADSVNVNLTLGGQLDVENIGKQVEDWLVHCQRAHGGRCTVPDNPPWVPKRLLDLTTLSEGRVVVRETELLPSPKPRFVTLSHCWGNPEKTPMLELKPYNIVAFTDPTKGIRKEQLPQNFKDAVDVAILLKAQYIWIDSLCILQDGEEFKTEGQFMHLVYRNSYCNLAAAASGDCEGGFFRERQKVDKFGGDIVETSETSVFGRGRWRVFPSEVWSDHLLMDPLYRRGWVFQERMLSPRILHFASGQVFWDCASTTACEVLPGGLPWQLDATSSSERYWRERLQLLQKKQQDHAGASTAAPLKLFGSADVSFESFWKEAVRNYTSCNLTRNTDRLLAIWGVAKLVRDQFRLDNETEDYGVGLWSSQLCEQLAWRAQDPSQARRPPELWRWPSWSWASMTGTVELQLRSSEPGLFYTARNHQDGEVNFELVGDQQAKGADNVPRNLQTERLALRGVFAKAAVQEQTTTVHKEGKGNDSHHTYSLRVLDADTVGGSHSTGMFTVLPDSKSDFPQDLLGDCFLVILTASFDQDENLGDSSPWPDDQASGEEETTAWIHGTGLVVVRRAGPNQEISRDCWEYLRIGVCNFEGLSSDEFSRLEGSHTSNIWLI